MRFGCLFILLAFYLVPASAQSGRVQPTPTPTPEDTVKIETEEIKLNILAIDESGKFFRDVVGTDLVITDDNILHQPTSVRRMPANVLIVMDTGGEMRFKKSLDQTRRTAAALVEALAPEDQIAIIQYSDKAEIVADWTSDREKLAAAIGRTKFGIRSVFVDAVSLAAETLAKQPNDSRHLVLITDGTDSFYGTAERSAALKRLLSTDISVHVISYTRMEANDIEPRTKGISKSPPPKAMPDEVAATLPNGARDIARAPKIGPTIIVDRKHLKKMRERRDDLEKSELELTALADNTNGTIIIPLDGAEMVEKTVRVAAFIDASYVVTYEPKVSVREGGNERLITVTSRRPGLIVQAKRRFIRASEQ